jgi:hypothetical protein
MKTGISLQDLARKLEENRDAKKDFITDTREARVVFDGGKFAIDMQGQGTYPLQPHPLRQIGEHTGVPAKYMERMRAEAPELLVTNVNAWFDRKPERRMVRTLRSEGRAFLSNRYQRIENDRIAEVALPALAEFPGIQVVSTEVTDSRLYLQAVVPSIEGEVVGKGGRKVGDLMRAGVVISYSEVGLGRVAAAIAGDQESLSVPRGGNYDVRHYLGGREHRGVARFGLSRLGRERHMRQVGPRAPVFSPGELLTIGNLFAQGLDTWQIARRMSVPEHDVANCLGVARAHRRREMARRAAPAESVL